MKILVAAIIVVVLEQQIQLAYGVPCTANPCNLVPGVYDGSTGYCCTDIPPAYTDSVCSCPNNVPPVVNQPCRGGISPNQLFCNRTCLNGGVCNIVNGAEVCWCLSGYAGPSCESQSIGATCTAGVCFAGTCVQEAVGTSTNAYCYCNPGWTGPRCDLCYFSCTGTGSFPDTANCALGRYFYCSAANAAPVVAQCPAGLKFNRATSQCDATYNCT